MAMRFLGRIRSALLLLVIPCGCVAPRPTHHRVPHHRLYDGPEQPATALSFLVAGPEVVLHSVDGRPLPDPYRMFAATRPGPGSKAVCRIIELLPDRHTVEASFLAIPSAHTAVNRDYPDDPSRRSIVYDTLVSFKRVSLEFDTLRTGVYMVRGQKDRFWGPTVSVSYATLFDWSRDEERPTWGTFCGFMKEAPAGETAVVFLRELPRGLLGIPLPREAAALVPRSLFYFVEGWHVIPVLPD
ncbi:MAG: hypothetical protein FJ290_22215 [Planctomycetes bacterium]|nr:hypothetical protein [Planctomycetota bacterium]